MDIIFPDYLFWSQYIPGWVLDQFLNAATIYFQETRYFSILTLKNTKKVKSRIVNNIHEDVCFLTLTFSEILHLSVDIYIS